MHYIYLAVMLCSILLYPVPLSRGVAFIAAVEMITERMVKSGALQSNVISIHGGEEFSVFCALFDNH